MIHDPVPHAGPLVSDSVFGVVTGTLILTRDGEIPVEYLGAGDDIITRDGGFTRLVALTRRRRICRAIRVRAGALDNMHSDYDLILPATQPILLRDWRARALFGTSQVLVPVGRVTDGETILDLGPRRMDLHCLELNGSHVFYADGLELASAPRTDSPLRQAA